MGTESKMVAEGARVLLQKTCDPDRSFYLPQVKVGGVWLDVSRSDYQPHDFRSCVEAAMAAARNELEKGDEVVWEVEEFDSFVEGETVTRVGISCDHADDALTTLEDLVRELGLDDEPDEEPLVRVVRVDEEAGIYGVQFKVGAQWIGASVTLGIDAAVRLAELVSGQLRREAEDTKADDVVWVDRGSLG